MKQWQSQLCGGRLKDETGQGPVKLTLVKLKSWLGTLWRVCPLSPVCAGDARGGLHFLCFFCGKLSREIWLSAEGKQLSPAV